MNRVRISFVCVAVLLGSFELAQAVAERTVMLALDGQYCDLYLGEVESSLKQLAGVKAVDVKSRKGRAIVTIEGDKATPNQLVKAVNGLKGDGALQCAGDEIVSSLQGYEFLFLRWSSLNQE